MIPLDAVLARVKELPTLSQVTARLAALLRDPRAGAAEFERVIRAVEGLLRPGGLLCLGHTETLSGVRCGLKIVRPSVFRRPDGERAG